LTLLNDDASSQEATDALPRLPVRRLHNFAYCPRLFYLQWVENLFVENGDTIEGQHVHRNVDKPTVLDENEKASALPEGARLRSLRLESIFLGLTGVIDLVEERNGIIRLVDFKKGAARRDENGERAPKYPDLVQVLAYVMMLHEENIYPEEATIYYAAEKRHVLVPLTPENYAQCRQLIKQAKETAIAGKCPPPLEEDSRCLYCSAYPICLPNESAYWAHGNGCEREIVQPPRPENDEGEVLIVQKAGAVVGIRAQQFTVSFRDEVLKKLPVRQVRAIYLYGAIQVTAAAAQFCLENEVDVSYFSPAGRFLGLLRGLPASGIDARLGQYRAYENLPVRLLLAREFIRAKIHNQRVMLMRNANPQPQSISELEHLRDRALEAQDITSLMGTEGRAAAIYFSEFSGMLREGLGFSFEARNRRPPRDPVNALLSLAYSVLSKEFTGVCYSVGLDPFVGFLHAPRYGRPALALDLMEEFRPLIADSVAISLINRQELDRGDFIFSSNGVFLAEEGRRSFWEAYSRRMDTEIKHPVFGYKMAYRRMIEVQCRQVWRVLRGDVTAYQGFTTR